MTDSDVITISINRRHALGLLAAPLFASLGSCRRDLFGPREMRASVAASSSTAAPITLIGAGDQHAVTNLNRVHREATAQMIRSVLNNDATAWAFNAGDLTHNGSEAELAAYDDSWGAFRDRTLFTLGNHDRMTDPTGAVFYDYTGSERYFARTFGSWRFYVLTCESMSQGGPDTEEQLAWFQADVAQHAATHHLAAMWHYPQFSNVCAHAGKEMTWPGRTGPMWQVLQDNGGEFVISGHVHRWERFAPLVRTGLRSSVASSDGMRQFVCGGGGGNTYDVLSRHPHCERVFVERGVARFDLYPDRYEWSFTNTSGVVRDSGTHVCRKQLGSEPEPPPEPCS